MPLLFVRNDITKVRADAIVNAANPSLLGGGGVDGAIHAAAGPGLLEECRGLGGCGIGQAKITGAYRLPARYVIHTVGPVWQGGRARETELLSECYRNSLALALEHGCESIAFPLISAGAYGMPKELACRVAVQSIRAFLETQEMTVTLVLFDRQSLQEGALYTNRVVSYVNNNYVNAALERGRAKQAAGFPPPGPLQSGYFSRRKKAAAKEAAPELCEEPREACAEPVLKAYAEPVPQAYAEASDAFFSPKPAAARPGTLEEAVSGLDESFQEMLFRLIDKRGLTDPQCYKRANLSRQHFSKIRSQAAYQPTRETVYALALALRLSLAETRELLSKGGFSMSRSNLTDVILEYYISRGIYDIDEINFSLCRYDRALLGAR